MVPSTSDLLDQHGAAAAVCELPLVRYGRRRDFAGAIATVRCHEDNVLVRLRLSEPGQGRVLVVDGGGSLRVALVGDQLAGMALANGWAAIVINGCVRDVAALAGIDIGIKALAACPGQARSSVPASGTSRSASARSRFTPAPCWPATTTASWCCRRPSESAGHDHRHPLHRVVAVSANIPDRLRRLHVTGSVAGAAAQFIAPRRRRRPGV